MDRDIASIATGSRIVVGVDGSPTSAAALAWAVDECAALGASLLIAHCPAPADPRQVWAGGEVALRVLDRHADSLLTAFAAASSRRRPSVVVTTHLSHSEPSNALVDLSTGSQLLVVGAPGGRSAAFGIGRRVVAHANCPVVLVPDPVALPTARRASRVVRILTGGAEDDAARQVAELAARLRGLPLESIAYGSAHRCLREEPAVLAVVGLRGSEDHWSVRPTAPLDGLLAALPCPLAIVGVGVANEAFVGAGTRRTGAAAGAS
ncbi:MAG: universal stress protein [Sporichthyaceae bacterium]